MQHNKNYVITKSGRSCEWERDIRLQIIHVDMNKYVLQAMQEALARLVPDAQLHSFLSIDLALAFAKAHGCDVLLTEIELWRETLGGIRLAKAVQELYPQADVLFVTVFDAREVEREISALRVSGFLPKPWSPEELEAAFQNLIR